VDKIGGLDDAIVSGLFSIKLKLQTQVIQNMRKILMTFWLISCKIKTDFIKKNWGRKLPYSTRDKKITNSKRCSNHPLK
jgi:hypothetical protein